jgi:hypothetical protein
VTDEALGVPISLRRDLLWKETRIRTLLLGLIRSIRERKNQVTPFDP